MAKRILLAASAFMTLVSACATPNYLPVHGQGMEETAAARMECRAISEGMTPEQGGGFIAVSGRPAFVGAALGAGILGLVITAAVQQQHKIEIYDDCMVAHGYRRAL